MGAPKTRVKQLKTEVAAAILKEFGTGAAAFDALNPGISREAFWRVLRCECCTADELNAVTVPWFVLSTRVISDDVANEVLRLAMDLVKERCGKKLHPLDLIRELTAAVKSGSGT